MRLVYKGSVNRWECDENDHMNVRFYSRKIAEALYGAVKSLDPAKELVEEEIIEEKKQFHLNNIKERKKIRGFLGHKPKKDN